MKPYPNSRITNKSKQIIKSRRSPYINNNTNNNRILRIKKKDGKCFFLENGKCTIYKIRPKICRIYPYWCVKLINGRVKLIEHDSDTLCLVRNLNTITKEEEIKIRKLFNEILKEAEYYKKNVINFVKTNNL